jgi:hypothetical protein
MKKGMAVLAILLAFLGAGCETKAETAKKGPRTGIIILLSPDQDDQALEEARRFILHLLFRGMDGGDALTVVDAGTRNEVASFAYPEVDLKTDNLKKKYVSKEWERFLSYSRKVAGNGKDHGSLDIPLFSRWLSDRLAVERKQRMEVLFIGSPLHRDSDPRFSFGRDNWLSDAAFFQDTPFRIPDGKSDRFNGVFFHFVYFHSPFVNTKHHDRIKRFWSLYFSQQGGGLVTFTSDAQAFRRIKTDIRADHFDPDPEDCRYVAWHSAAETVLAKDDPAPARSDNLVISMRYENRGSDVDLVAVLQGRRLDFKTSSAFGVHKKHLVTGSEEIVTGFNPEMAVKLEHVNGPPPGKVFLSIFSENGERLASREYDGFQRWASYNLQVHEVSFNLADLLGENRPDPTTLAKGN